MASYFFLFSQTYMVKVSPMTNRQNINLVKNIFRRARAREDLNKYTLFEAYEIEDGDTASSITLLII